MKQMILADVEHPTSKLRERFSLTALGAKSIYLSCPEFQEKFCRKRIQESKKRGGSQYGSKHFLRRRYKLAEQDLDLIFDDIWNNPADKVSKKFMEVMTVDKISEVHLTKRAQLEISKIKEAFSL